MRSITLNPVDVTPELLSYLEERRLVKTLRPTPEVLAPKHSSGAVSTLYTSSAAFGTHKLICVGKKLTSIELSSHGDNEDIILLNPAGLTFKPLYFIVGLYEHEELEARARDGLLSADDFLTLRMKFDDPRTCVFTVLKGTPHCEVTEPGDGMHPIFFVSEPSELAMEYLDVGPYRFEPGPGMQGNTERQV